MVIRKTRSVCPVCLQNLPAALCRREDGRIFMEKTCPEHGSFQTLIWQGGQTVPQTAASARSMTAAPAALCWR